MNKKNTIKRVWRICKPYHRYIFVLLGFLFIQQIIIACFPIIIGSAVMAVTNRNTKSFFVAAIIWLGLGASRACLGYLREYFEIKNLDYELARYMSRVSMKKFFDISMGQHRLGHSVIKRSVISKGEAAVIGIVYVSIYDLVPTLLFVGIPVVLLLVKAPLVGVLVGAAITFFLLYTLKYNGNFIPRIRKLDTLANKVGKRIAEFIEHADVVFVNAQEQRVRNECDSENQNQGVVGKPIWCGYVSWLYGGQFFIALSQVSCIAVAGYLAFNNQMTAGMFVTTVMWISSSMNTLHNVSHIQRNMAKNFAPVAKYFRFLDYEPDIIVPERPIELDKMHGRIEFRDVSFHYRTRDKADTLNDDEPDGDDGVTSVQEVAALKNVSFVLQEGGRYAFVGKSGAGKSTLVGLILRAYDPQNGHVLIDGVDLRMLDFRKLRQHIGLVPQEVALFDGTMKYNVTFGLNGRAVLVSDAEIENVAKLARLTEFSSKLENGWDTVIGERGIKLSGGQRQRVGIARALIKNPQVLIFDEATSNLDTENEAGIRESIMQASVGKTTIIIAHRLATVKDADKIFVFDEGCLVGEGTHTELLQQNSFYQRLVQNQVIMS